MIDFQRIYHTGIVVDDVATAQRELGEALNLEWTPLRIFDPLPFWTPETGLQSIRVEAVYSRQGPHHMEIVKGPKGGFYDPANFPDGRHIGVWVDDLQAEIERLIAAGWKVLAAGAAPEDGYGVLAYLRPPTAGLVVELVSVALRPAIDEWLAETA
jgi:hypothetical protein